MSSSIAVAPPGREGAARPLRRVDPAALTRYAGLTVTWVLLLALVGVNIALQPSILDVTQVGLIVQTALPLVFACVAQSIVLVSGGIDLSIGGTLVLGNVLAATWLNHGVAWHLPLIVLFGAGFGALNGALVVFAKVEPFIATLATWSIYDGIALHLLATDGGSTPQSLTSWITGTSFGIPSSIVVLAVVALWWWHFAKTRAGRHLYATGSDPVRAALGGVNVSRTRFQAFVLSGVIATIGGICLALITSTGSPTAGSGYILPSIEGAVIGGVTLTGGQGGAGLAIAGAFILTFITSVSEALNLAPWVATVISAALLLAVVAARTGLQHREA